VKKIFAIVIVGISFTSPAYADWWDCKVSYRTSGTSGDGTMNFNFKGNITREISADRRSDAERKAGQGAHITTGGFFSKNIYACTLGNKIENGERCRYHFGPNPDCRRQ